MQDHGAYITKGIKKHDNNIMHQGLKCVTILQREKSHRNYWYSSHLAEGKSRCGKSFGIFPTLRISVYGKFFTTTIFHNPIKPILSGVWPSEASVCRVISSMNITKQTFFLDNRVTWKLNNWKWAISYKSK